MAQLFHIFALVPFFARPKPKISFFGLSLLRSETRKHSVRSVDTQAIPFLYSLKDLIQRAEKDAGDRDFAGFIYGGF